MLPALPRSINTPPDEKRRRLTRGLGCRAAGTTKYVSDTTQTLQMREQLACVAIFHGANRIQGIGRLVLRETIRGFRSKWLTNKGFQPFFLL